MWLCCCCCRFSHVQLCVTPETAAHQAPPSLGFSRQEHWSGLPFPSPKHESEKWKLSHSVVSDSVWPHKWQPTRLPHPWDSLGKNTGVGCHFLLQCMKVKVKSLSHVRLSATPWTAAYQAPPSMGFSRQEYWSGVPLPSPLCNYKYIKIKRSKERRGLKYIQSNYSLLTNCGKFMHFAHS